MTPRSHLVLGMLNAALLVFLLAQHRPVTAQSVPPVLRGSALEIVDTQGRVRASITVNPPETVAGQAYPESVLFRIFGDPAGGPGVKLEVSREKSVLRLADGSDVGAVELRAEPRIKSVRVIDRGGRERRLTP